MARVDVPHIPLVANLKAQQLVNAKRPTAMVISHERSGTHFLINAISAAYGYPASRLVHFDQMTLNINYFSKPSIVDAVRKIARRGTPAIIKSHHPVEFFDDAIDELLDCVTIFYIHRDPVDVMISFWRYMHIWKWNEGPRLARAMDFAAAEPEGQMLRYQTKQRRNMLHRWAHHVDGWTHAAEGRSRLIVVRYDQLRDAYEKTVSAFVGALGPVSGTLTPPNRRTNVITGPPADRFERPDKSALHELALAEVGDTMRRHGYE